MFGPSTDAHCSRQFAQLAVMCNGREVFRAQSSEQTVALQPRIAFDQRLYQFSHLGPGFVDQQLLLGRIEVGVLRLQPPKTFGNLGFLGHGGYIDAAHAGCRYRFAVPQLFLESLTDEFLMTGVANLEKESGKLFDPCIMAGAKAVLLQYVFAGGLKLVVVF
ncbi:hypothetical protein D3C77_559990 [compost metagenome]